MCIRDRLRAIRHELEMNVRWQDHVEVVSASAMRQAFHRSDVLSVSYTHLRAHETVLDLVCRLLLEKKKKKKKQKTDNSQQYSSIHSVTRQDITYSKQ